MRLLWVLLFPGSLALAATSCEELSRMALRNATIEARQLASGTCRVAATLRPTSDSEIRMELWLPAASAWNGKLLAHGNGGWSGSISAQTLEGAANRGYAAAMSDTGHQGSSGSFALGHPEKLIDFGYRSSHEMTVAAKAITAAFYGRAASRSYWTGCSAGGRQAMMEAQRYPADFDGIVAGAPGLNWTGRALEAVWVAQAVHRDEASYIPREKYSLIHDAALAACDALDGVKDGLIADPEHCRFDPVRLQCSSSGDSACLAPEQVEAARRIYASRNEARSGRLIVPGLAPGSELGWATMGGPQPLGLGLDLFRYVVFKDAQWDYRSFRFDEDVPRTWEAEGGILNALDTNLKPFFERGGKLIQYHGWSDPQIPPGFTVDYYRSVVKALGERTVRQSYRLFMVPGMAHCGGGEGTSTFDMLAALEAWVERGKVPDSVPASRGSRTRPLCPYPQIAAYSGAGSIEDAANFACK
jgi:feruloyl esterase